ncbi:hypothetical protein GBA52_024396 [Prunus armeniaca]|nr:hypothetical protein GBA52_024396 [Prunus armeniaca]
MVPTMTFILADREIVSTNYSRHRRSYGVQFLQRQRDQHLENQIKNFPYPYSSTTLMSLMASIQFLVFAHYVERDWKQWKLGIMISRLVVTLMTWACAACDACTCRLFPT